LGAFQPLMKIFQSLMKIFQPLMKIFQPLMKIFQQLMKIFHAAPSKIFLLPLKMESTADEKNPGHTFVICNQNLQHI
jgi:hypothetical protein